MVKKLFIYIFIYTLLVGCNTQNPMSNSVECESDCYLDVEAPSLQVDENGYYHIEWLEGYYQTFSTLNANTGSTFLIQKVMWGSDKGIMWSGEPVSCVNSASYTSDDGAAHTVLSVWEVMIHDTITVYAGYYDECNNEHIDSIKVVVDNEISN